MGFEICDLRFCLAVIFLCLAPVGSLMAETSWILIPAPRFMGNSACFPIQNSKNTVLCPAKISSDGVAIISSEAEIKTANNALETLITSTSLLAEKWLEEITPEITRDAKNVITYGVLRSDTLPITVTVLSSAFMKRYENQFGPELTVVLPNRNTVFIFPELIDNHADYTPQIIRAWRSKWPKGSLEVFKITKVGLKAVGAFEEP